jgi:hypothetical protein
MGAGTANYAVAALASSPVTWVPGSLPHPAVDGLGIVNGQYFALARQADNTKNGIWYADPGGAIPIMTVGTTGINPATVIDVTGGLQNANQRWVYSANANGSGPGLVLE